MTKFKKCDCCQLSNKTVVKYKTGLVETFGTNAKATGNIISGARDRVVFFLCDPCKEYLITDPEAIRNNTVDERYWNEHLNNHIFKKSNHSETKIGGRKGY